MKHLKNFLVAASIAAVTIGSAFAQTSNKEIVVAGMHGLFMKRDMSVLDKYWVPNYIQHNPAVPNGTAVLKAWISNLPPEFKYEIGMVVAEGDLVMAMSHF